MLGKDRGIVSWLRGVDLAATRKYAKAVYAASDEFLASLSPGDLERPVDLSFVGLGESTEGLSRR